MASPYPKFQAKKAQNRQKIQQLRQRYLEWEAQAASELKGKWVVYGWDGVSHPCNSEEEAEDLTVRYAQCLVCQVGSGKISSCTGAMSDSLYQSQCETISNLLKRLDPEVRISMRGMSLANSIVNDFLKRLLMEAYEATTGDRIEPEAMKQAITRTIQDLQLDSNFRLRPRVVSDN
jgi:hypothetical protein